MKIKAVFLRNFRRLESVKIGFEAGETVFVGPNNSGKTSATGAFRLFLSRPDFKIHDLSVSRIAELDQFGYSDTKDRKTLPAIEMDLWFSIDPNIEFGRVFSLVPNVSTSLEEVGIRISYGIKDADKLLAVYKAAFPSAAGNLEKNKSLSHYLSLPGNMGQHFKLSYFAIDKTENEEKLLPLEPEEGKRVLRSLVRVDFVDAQRNIDDHESGRSNRLSSAFSAFYKKNLEQVEVNEAANKIIDQNNENLTAHYEKHFGPIMEVIKGLGVPSVNDRQMKIVSSMSPETALQGNTSLLYVDPKIKHELPEAYNGLGFKNLVYMAIQISHFHLQWMNTEELRPLCQIIFVEEPEVHLHAQVQQAFISNIWRIVQEASQKQGEGSMVPQIAVTTHSSHILDAVEFGKVRYFRRCHLEGEDETKVHTFNASKVLSLRDFEPDTVSGSEEDDRKKSLEFLKRYLKLTHCDLFFADAAVLVEGAVEKLLLPQIIEKSAPGLKQNYITALEVGGAYASRFSSLFEFLGIPYVVITDIDSVDPSDNGKACRADTKGAETSNASLKFLLQKTTVEDLIKLEPDEHVLASGNCFVAFQKPVAVMGHREKMHGRTFEESFVYQNMKLFRGKEIDLGVDLPKGQDFDYEYQSVYDRIRKTSFKKTDFALDIVYSATNWVPPQYIADGLVWLETRIGEDRSSDPAISLAS